MGVFTQLLVRLMQEAERRRMCGDGLIILIRVLGATHLDVPLQAIETSHKEWEPSHFTRKILSERNAIIANPSLGKYYQKKMQL